MGTNKRETVLKWTLLPSALVFIGVLTFFIFVKWSDNPGLNITGYVLSSSIFALLIALGIVDIVRKVKEKRR